MRTMLLALVMVTAAAHGQSAPDGEALYKHHCATCHYAGVPRAAARSVLEKLSPDSIRTTLNVGSMVQQAAALPPAQKDAIIAYLTRDSAPQPAVAVNSHCAPEKQTYSATLRTPHWTGWGNDVTQHRVQSDEQARLCETLGQRDRRNALTDLCSCDSLVKGHIFATQLHIQRATDLIAVDPPSRLTGGPVLTDAAQHVANRFVAMVFVIEMASFKRFVLEDWERERIEAGQA
jgi:Cytochrome C oxidase, cbb3-type, subunit III